MYRLLIIDDEPLALAGIRSLLDWPALGVDVIDTARNGGEAFDIIERQMPDVVITDIKMPVKDGISLIRECNEKFEFPPMFLVLTGYDDFCFVRSALQVKAVDYIIKTDVDEKLLTEAFNKAVNSLHGVSGEQYGIKKLRENFFINLFNNLFDSDENYTAQKELTGIKSSDFYVVAECLISFTDDGYNNKTNIRFLSNVIKIASDTLSRYNECYTVTLDIWRFAVVFPLNDKNGYIDLLSEAFQHTADALRDSLGVLITASVGGLVSDIRRLDISYSLAHSLRSDKKQGSVYFHNHKEHVVDDVKRYIRENFNRSLSLNEVATAFNFSPSYLSHLFSNYTGESIVDYITTLRISKAKKLLATGELSIADAAIQVGFENQFYFSRVFKRVTGVSPRKYIQSQKRCGSDFDAN